MLLFAALALAQDAELTVETWNVGLAYGFVDDATERRGPIFDALTEADADLVCLQETWERQDRRGVDRATESSYPHRVMLPIEQSRTARAPACRGKELFGEGRFVTCLTDTCGDFEGDDQTDCVIEQCGPVLEDLRDENPECATALMAQVGKSGLAAILAVRSPFRKPGVFAYKGSDGVALLSRRPLVDSGVLDFSDISTLNRRRALWADVAVGDETVRVYCTHLTANLDGIAPYPGPAESWGAEQALQAERLIAHAAEAEGPVVMTGDFNCGWAHEENGISGDQEENCALYTAGGFESVGLEDPVCTFCQENPIVAEDESEHYNARIDHVFVQGLYATEHGRTRDGMLPDGSTAYSDHYGFSATLRVGAPPENTTSRPEAQDPTTSRPEAPAMDEDMTEDTTSRPAPAEDAPSDTTGRPTP